MAGLAKLRNVNGSAGKVAISDSAKNVAAALGALVGDGSHLASIDLTGSGTPAMRLTAAQAKTDAALLKKITGGRVLDAESASGSWTTTGHGNDLTIVAIAGKDAITGGGSSEAFELKKGFKLASLVDFHAHTNGATHDVVMLRTSEFADFPALLADTKTAGANLVVTAANGDKLTLNSMTLAALNAHKSDFEFV